MRHTIIKVARSFVGTPFVYGGRIKDAAIDCFGLLIEVGKEAGIEIEDFTAYSRRNIAKNTLFEKVSERFVEIPHKAYGCVIIFRFYHPRRKIKFTEHSGIYTGSSIIHADGTRREVVEDPYNTAWANSDYAYFDYPGVK